MVKQLREPESRQSGAPVFMKRERRKSPAEKAKRREEEEFERR